MEVRLVATDVGGRETRSGETKVLVHILQSQLSVWNVCGHSRQQPQYMSKSPHRPVS